jgi:predicted SnoaL-like aldol condensation-catalyzing enzyme
MSTAEAENKAMFRRTYEELLNRGNLDVADELVAPEFINHEAPPGRDRGPDMHFVRFRDGKAVEHWGVRDDLGMMQQLGVIPEPGQAGEPGPI